jgi:RNA polymerase sigma-70 factor (ECF subfamily)
MGHSQPGRGAFPTTRWTLVVAAGGNGSNSDRDEALERLCSGYWHPVYAFIRRRGYSAEHAQDLTQQFFLGILDGAFFERADSGKGRFRGFMLGAVQHFLSNETSRENCQKRGGGVLPFSLDFATGESNDGREPKHTETPERIFQRKWARTVLDRVMSTLSDEFLAEGKLDLFKRIKVYMTGDGGLKYAELGVELNLTESGVKSAIRRMRHRYSDLLRQEVLSTVSDPSEVDDELRFLLRAISSQDLEVR